jgi:hypothetical protein
MYAVLNILVGDSQAQIFLIPDGNANRYFDNFVRSVSPALNKKPLFIDGVSGGRGPDSGQDSYEVRLEFH